MKKALIAASVATLVPAIAQAQTNVTLSGFLKSGVAQTKFSNGVTGNGSATALADGASRFVISGTEDLGSGLKALFRLDNRFRVDDNASGGKIGTGAVFVGLGGSFGSVRVGKLDTYYFLGTDEFSGRAVASQHSNLGILGYVNSNANPIARLSRSTNIVRYDTPSFGGLSGSVSWSPNANGGEGVPGGSKGQAWSADAGYRAGALSLGAAYWDEEAENNTASGQSAWRVFGAYGFGRFRVGLTYDDARLTTAGVDRRRAAWSVPVTMKLGLGTLLFTYTQAQDTKTDGARNADTGARSIAVGYDYPLSKRTSLGVSYMAIGNEAGAAYGFYNASLANVPAPVAGQDAKQLYVGLRHAF